MEMIEVEIILVVGQIVILYFPSIFHMFIYLQVKEY